MAGKKDLAECFKKTYVTPLGEASYPHLAEPNTKFDKDGRYELTLYFDEEAGSKFAASLEEAYNQAGEEARAKWEEQKPQYKKDNPKINYDSFYKEEVDDNGFSTGRIFARFSKDAKITTKDKRVLEFKVAVFDRYNKPMTAEEIKKAGSGSKIVAAFKVLPYFVLGTCKAGISLKLDAVQIVEAKEWTGSKSADSYGFKSFEDEDCSAFNDSAFAGGDGANF